jgi:hypothetical protein
MAKAQLLPRRRGQDVGDPDVLADPAQALSHRTLDAEHHGRVHDAAGAANHVLAITQRDPQGVGRPDGIGLTRRAALQFQHDVHAALEAQLDAGAAGAGELFDQRLQLLVL